MKTKIKNVIENTGTIQGRAFAFTIQVLIVVSLVTFSISTLHNLSESTRKIVQIIEIFTVSIFTLEYLCRVTIADNKLGFIISFYGVIDLMAILPFYIASGIDLRAVRIFRLLRLFRILKLLRYSQALTGFIGHLLSPKKN